MTLLVAGADRVDAGKTTFTVGLIAHTGAIGFKPRAGNDYWFHHDDYRQAVDEGRMYGKDARRITAASAADVTPEDINPVHRLWRPSPGGRTGILGQQDREFVLDRIEDEYVVNGTVDVPPEAAERLPLADATVVTSLAEFNDVMDAMHVPALAALHDRIEREGTRMSVVESYGDIARPIQDLTPDGVAVVEPARCRVYDGGRYARACEVASGSPRTGRLETSAHDVVDLIEPAATIELPALVEAERFDPETVATAYGDAYDALLDAA